MSENGSVEDNWAGKYSEKVKEKAPEIHILIQEAVSE